MGRIERFARQANDVDEQLTPAQRIKAEEYYKSKGVGSSAKERYEHFRDDPKLSRFYRNFHCGGTDHTDVSRLASLEWIAWRWDGSI